MVAIINVKPGAVFKINPSRHARQMHQFSARHVNQAIDEFALVEGVYFRRLHAQGIFSFDTHQPFGHGY